MDEKIQKLRKAFQELIKSLGYSKERETEVYNTVIRPLEILIEAAKDPESEAKKILRRFRNSIFYSFSNIDERVIENQRLKRDTISKLNEKDIYEKSTINSSYVKTIEDHINLTQSPDQSRGITVESLQIQDSNQHRQNRIEISLDWLMHLLFKFSQDVQAQENIISDLGWSNFLLNFKVYLTNEFYPHLIAIFKITNNLGTDNPIVLTKFLIQKYTEALSPDKQLSILNTAVFEDKGIEICKITADRYCKIMLKVYQGKLYHLQGIKLGEAKAGKEVELPKHKNIEIIQKTIEKELWYLPTENLKKELIMRKEEFNELKAMISSLILNEEIPFIEAPIRRLDVSNQTIIYSFYKIHKKLFGTKQIKDFFITFLKATFSQLDDYTPSTIKAKFSVRPNRFPY